MIEILSLNRLCLFLGDFGLFQPMERGLSEDWLRKDEQCRQHKQDNCHTDECAAADEPAQHADELHTGDEGHTERCREEGETAC